MEELNSLLNELKDINPNYDFCIDCSEMHKFFVELKEKIDNGLLLYAPCKVDDTIFYIIDFGSVVGECINIEVGTVDEISFKKDGIFIHANYKGFKARHTSADIGKDIFFNKDQAEDKLKQLREGN